MQLLHWEHIRAEVSAAQGTADGHGRNVVAGQGPGKPNRNSRTMHGARGRRNNIHQSQRWQPKHTRSVTRLSRQSWRSATAGKQEQASANHPSASCHVRCYSITSMCCLLVDTAAIIRLTGLKCSPGLRQNRNGADEQTCCNDEMGTRSTRAQLALHCFWLGNDPPYRAPHLPSTGCQTRVARSCPQPISTKVSRHSSPAHASSNHKEASHDDY